MVIIASFFVLLLSFESWSRLRREQGLSIKKAREVLSLAVAKVAS